MIKICSQVLFLVLETFFLPLTITIFFIIIYSYLVKIDPEKMLIVVDEEYTVGSHK